MAVELGITSGRMSQIRYGAPMSSTQIHSFCKASNTSPSWLFFNIGPKRLSDLEYLSDKTEHTDMNNEDHQ